MEQESKESQKKEPTTEDLVDALREVIDDETLEELLPLDLDEALGFAFSLLLENGIDPDEFLRGKGILE